MVGSLFLLRHGKTPLAGKLVGATDVDLGPVGIEQIHRIRKTVREENFSHVFCSPMKRCRRTAEILDLDTGISFVEELKEIDFGHWEGLEFSEIERNDPGSVRSWVEDPEGFRFPGGESCAEFSLRLEGFKIKLQEISHDKVLVITHGGVIRHLICSFLGIPARNYLLFQIREGLLSSLDCFGDRGVLTGLNRGGMLSWDD